MNIAYMSDIAYIGRLMSRKDGVELFLSILPLARFLERVRQDYQPNQPDNLTAVVFQTVTGVKRVS